MKLLGLPHRLWFWHICGLTWAQIQNMNVLLFVEGDGFAEAGKWYGLGLKSFDTVCGLWWLCLFFHIISGK